jgi:hypothetical protein
MHACSISRHVGIVELGCGDDANAGAWVQEGVCPHSWHLPQARHSERAHGGYLSDTYHHHQVTHGHPAASALC